MQHSHFRQICQSDTSPPPKSHSVWFLQRRPFFLSLSFFLPAPHGLWDLRSPTRDQTRAHGSESLTTRPQVSSQRGHSPIQPQCCHQNQDTETSVSLPPKPQTPSPAVCCPPGLFWLEEPVEAQAALTCHVSYLLDSREPSLSLSLTFKTFDTLGRCWHFGWLILLSAPQDRQFISLVAASCALSNYWFPYLMVTQKAAEMLIHAIQGGVGAVL